MLVQSVSDRRSRAIRRSVRIACEVVRAWDFRRVAKQALELSRGGMLVVPECRVLTGEPLIVTFKVPLGSPIWFDAEAVVSRVIHGRRPGDTGPALGLSFGWTDPRGAAALEAQLGWFAESRGRSRPQH